MATSSIQARAEMKMGESRTRDVIKSRISMLDSSNDTDALAIVADTLGRFLTQDFVREDGLLHLNYPDLRAALHKSVSEILRNPDVPIQNRYAASIVAKTAIMQGSPEISNEMAHNIVEILKDERENVAVGDILTGTLHDGSIDIRRRVAHILMEKRHTVDSSTLSKINGLLDFSFSLIRREFDSYRD
jgi:hypothetical protein